MNYFLKVKDDLELQDETRGYMEYVVGEFVTVRWGVIRACVKLLCIHQRAVIRANHPARKRARGEFECDDEE